MDVVLLAKAAVMGIVEGLTEFLPISSSAHLAIIPRFLGWEDPGAAYTAVVQVGTAPTDGGPGTVTLYSPTSTAQVIILPEGDIEVQPADGRNVFVERTEKGDAFLDMLGSTILSGDLIEQRPGLAAVS